jgi:integrase
MSVLFNHARRYDLFDRNPISLVRQSAKRRTIPEVLSVDEVQRLLDALTGRERTLVLLDLGTGLRRGELFGLKWKDVDFEVKQLSVTRSIFNQVVGPCKTEASQKPVPLDASLVEALWAWRQQAKWCGPEDWVFASRMNKGRNPYRAETLMREYILPAAHRVGINKRIGWHTFRHTYCTLLKAVGADIKVMQELLRHASSRVTMDTYTQACRQSRRNVEICTQAGLGE